MSATLEKYKTSDYLESSGNFLTKKEKSSIQHLGNAWQQYSSEVELAMPTYFQDLRFVEFIKKNISKRGTSIRKSPENYISFDEEIISIVFEPLYEEIELSKEILDLEEGWDGYDAPSIPRDVYNKSITFLKDYCNFIYKNTGIAITAPEINPGRNENIFLSWRTEKARLAISIENKDEELIAKYYGDLNNKQPIKGYVSIEEFSEYLAYWMKNLI